jgi:steroid 5-alpha reductase family enzyme
MSITAQFVVWGTVTVIMIFTIAWLIQLQTKNGAVADVVWAITSPLLTFVYFLIADNHSIRHTVILLLTTLWGLRLGAYLLLRSVGKPEDARYTALRKEWGSKQNLFMLRFYYFQAIAALVLSLPFAILIADPKAEIGFFEIAGIALWFVGIVGESLADAQLKKFKDNPFNKNRVCDTGLWHYSRHPNYFFEWLIWIAFFIMALAAPWGIVSILSPIAMYYLLTRVTGIEYTEQHMLKTRGKSFADYQQTTLAFFPLPKRKT